MFSPEVFRDRIGILSYNAIVSAENCTICMALVCASFSHGWRASAAMFQGVWAVGHSASLADQAGHTYIAALRMKGRRTVADGTVRNHPSPSKRFATGVLPPKAVPKFAEYWRRDLWRGNVIRMKIFFGFCVRSN